MNLLENADELKSWDSYREFLKKQLKLLDGEGVCFVSKEKLDFDKDGKAWRGHALLAGPKAEIVMRKMRKDGLLFREGTVTKAGKDLTLAGLMPKLVKESAKTMLKLKLGYKLEGGEESDFADDLEATWLKLKTAMTKHIRSGVEAGSEIADDVKSYVKQATVAEKGGDYESAIQMFKDLGKLILGGEKKGPEPTGDPMYDAGPDGRLDETHPTNMKAVGSSISQDVGKGGANVRNDVILVQRWLCNHEFWTAVNGVCDASMIGTIKEFQEKALRFRNPDGLVEARGTSERALKKKPVLYDQTAETEVEEELKTFFQAFEGIPIVVDAAHHKANGESENNTVWVTPPYHINAGDRKTNALTAREGNAAVAAVVKKLPRLAQVGKADPGDIKFFLETCISKGLVSNKTYKGLRDFLAKYGVSTDCSGLVGQALNHLTDGNMETGDGDPIDLMNVGSGSMKGGGGSFTKVGKPSSLKAGDTMHVKGHIRILVDVDREGALTTFRTMESSPKEDVVEFGDGRNDKKAADGGVGAVDWRYDDDSCFGGLQRSTDHGKTWKPVSDSGTTYGRWKAMPG